MFTTNNLGKHPFVFSWNRTFPASIQRRCLVGAFQHWPWPVLGAVL